MRPWSAGREPRPTLHKKMGQATPRALPRGQRPQRKEIDMSTIPRRSTGTAPIKGVNEGGHHGS